MAEIILTPLLQVIFEKLANPVLQEIAYNWDLENQFKKLQRVLPLAQAVIQDAEESQISVQAVRVWLSQLKDAAHKAEDLLEEFIYMARDKHVKPYAVNIRKSRNILDDLQKAVVEGLNLRLEERSVSSKQLDMRETSSFGIGSEVCGRKEEKRKIVEMLLSSSSKVNTYAVSIVGFPGIGKSTLAQMVYNDDEVKKHFDLRIWVFVSRDFNAKRVIKTAIESMTGMKCDLTDLDTLQSKLWNALKEKKYLVVLDDVWNEDQDEWDKLRVFFSCGIDGSRVVVTTRSQKVAMVIGSLRLAYNLKGLCEEDCWDLFRKRAFLNEEENDHMNLVAIGKEIARKCRGFPLASKVLGGLMRFKREEKDWLHVQKSDIWDLGAYRKGVFPALVVSYLHLPLHLKHCFALCSIFPNDHEFEREKLIHMWMAHGFLLPDGESKLIEDIGDEYFNELLWMSVLEEVKECAGFGCGRAYRMNEVFYSLARTIAENEFAVVGRGLVGRNLGQIRHLSVLQKYTPGSSLIPETLNQLKHLRTLLVFSEGGLQTVPSHVFSSFIYLRELTLTGCQVKLPDSIGNVPLLKYLDLSNSHFQELPSTVSSLCRLQVLNLFGCYNLKHLPSMVYITGLRHLNISGCEAIMEMPSEIGNLVYLQTLPIYIVPMRPPRNRKRHFRFRRQHRKFLTGNLHSNTMHDFESLADLHDLDLRNELKIKHLERVSDIQHAIEANLINKAYLNSLGLCWGNEGSYLVMNPSLSVARFQERKPQEPGPSEEPATDSDPYLAGEVLASLQPHKNLKKLVIVGYPGFGFPQWILPNLTEITLINCKGSLHMPILGHFPLLRSLHMEGMDSITSIGQEFYGEDVSVSFPSLQDLFISNFPSLCFWSSLDVKHVFPQLKKLIIKHCPNLVSVPLIMSLKHLELHNCNPLVLEWSEELPQLSTLVIEGFEDLISLPEHLLRDKPSLECLKITSCPKLQFLVSEFRGLSSLKSLSIQWCEELPLLPKGFHTLTALESLEISDCHSMISLPESAIGQLTSLKALSVENCSKLTSISIGFQHLASLKYLTIMYCPSLADFPENLDHLLDLTSLTIISCPLLRALPEGLKNAKSLRSLEIRSCPGITDLPQWLDCFASLTTLAISDCHNLKSLPAAIRRLAKLQHLSIQDCPDLQRQCRPDRGADWWKIAHVPHRYIFSSHQQQSSGGTSNLA